MSGQGSPARYQIRIDGVLDSCSATWLEGLRVHTEGTQTVVTGVLADQPALHGVLTRIRDLCLVSVRRLDSDRGE